MDVLWQKTPTPDGVFHLGRVGINTDHPEEALTVHGNIKLTGHILQPSDIRAKEDLKEVSDDFCMKNISLYFVESIRDYYPSSVCLLSVQSFS